MTTGVGPGSVAVASPKGTTDTPYQQQVGVVTGFLQSSLKVHRPLTDIL